MAYVIRQSKVATPPVSISMAYLWPYYVPAAYILRTGRNGRPNGPELPELDPWMCFTLCLMAILSLQLL